MSLSTAVDGLQAGLAELGGAVAELVMIVHEDRPDGSDLAVVDHLGEVVSELQGSVVGAASALGGRSQARELPVRLPKVDEQLWLAAAFYWRDLRSYDAVAELRRSAQGRGGEWRTWPGSVQDSVDRCEAPLGTVLTQVRAAWREIAELLVLYLPVSPVQISSPNGSAPEEIR